MKRSIPDKVEHGFKRALAAVAGLVVGVLLGLVGGLLLFGFGDAALIAAGVGGLLGATTCYLWPGPILFVLELALSVIGIDL
ncbi:MAG: hypothetical protein GY946_29745 [bacterium]|nr:hypothetical protein [bacterium]